MTDIRAPATLAIALALALLPTAAAEEPSARIAEDAHAIVLSNAHISVTFENKTPLLAIASLGQETRQAYEHRFAHIVEYRDLDGDGNPSANEIVASFDLAAATGWNATGTISGRDAVVNLTRTGPLDIAPGARAGLPGLPAGAPNVTLPEKTANVSLVFTLAPDARAVQADLVVARWSPVGSDTRLALLSDIEGALNTNETVAGVVADNETVGALGWSAKANGTTSAGAVEVPVRANATATDNTTRLALVYDVAGLTALTHEASVGLAPTPDLPLDAASDGPVAAVRDAVPGAPIAALGVAALAGALLLRRR